MKKRFIYFLSAITIVAATGCKKNHSDSAIASIEKKLIKVINVEYPGNTSTFTYDAGGRLQTAEDSATKTTYTFNLMTVDYKKYSKTENRNSRVGTLAVNGRGFVISDDMIYYPTANSSNPYKQTYEYNANGNPSKVTTIYSANIISEITIEFIDGNMSQEIYKSNGILSTTWKYSYSNIPDKNGLYNAFFDWTNSLGGIGSKFLESKGYEYDNNNVLIDTVTFTYEMDPDGYPFKMTMHYNAANKDYHTIYLYNK